MSTPTELPQEILVEIFARLPTKSVGQCRCLSKTWNTKLSTANFVNSHLTHQEKGKQLAIVIRWENLHIANLPSENEEEGTISEGLDFGEGLIRVLGSCNGLVMLLKDWLGFTELIVANPVSGQQVIIPNPPTPIGANDCHMYGFGYDPSSDDYKVVTFSYLNNVMDKRSFVDVYSLKLKTWKRVGEFHYSPFVYIMPFVSGAVHWLTRDNDCDSIYNWLTKDGMCDRKYRIEALDLATETFHQVPLPDALTKEKGYQALVVVNECLGVVFSTDEIVHVWVMKEYGVLDSWVKLSFDVSMMGKAMKPVCSLDGRDILYVSTDGMDCLLSCDREGYGPIHWGFDNASWSFFVDSLVYPKQENVVAH